MKTAVSTKYGVFEVEQNASNKAHTNVYYNDNKVIELNCPWWNLDVLHQHIEQNKDTIFQKIELFEEDKNKTIAALQNEVDRLTKEQNKINITANNVVESLKQ